MPKKIPGAWGLAPKYRISYTNYLSNVVSKSLASSATPYLAQQVIKEAKRLGISVDDDPRSLSVARGRSILVTNIFVLLNGRSKFGVGESNVSIGSLVLDDAHACLTTAEHQFTINIPAPSSIYDQFLSLFYVSLQDQSSTGVMEIEQGDKGRMMAVPFWSWSEHPKKVETLLMAASQTFEEVGFVWPLLKDHIAQCRCVFGPSTIEISPQCLPIQKIPSFVNAKHRVFMSATFADDSILIEDFNANATEIEISVAPGNASDIGDRLILVPQEIDPNISDDEIKLLAKEVAKRHNVVVIVPSDFRASFWNDVCDLEVHASTLESAVERLKDSLVGLVVVVNKYDGIDLPYNACRLLILDGLPDVRRLADKIEHLCLSGSNIATGREIQKIEQGMGRGVRATDDHCAVLLMGRSLVNQLYHQNGVEAFTPATKSQFRLSEQVAEQIRGSGIAGLKSAIDAFLGRDSAWVAAAKAAIVNVPYGDDQSDVGIALARRRAFDAAHQRRTDIAVDEIQNAVNSNRCSLTKGWLMSELAELKHPINAVEAQNILSAAIALNPQLPVRPQSGIHYVRLNSTDSEQANAVINAFKKIGSSSRVIIAANAIIEELAFRPDSFRRFERNLHDAAFMIGFVSQMPERDYGKGSDVLWATGGLKYLVIECKNEATPLCQ